MPRPGARRHRIFHDVDPVDRDGAAVRLDERREHAQRGRLAGAVRPEQAGDHAVLRAQRHVVDRDDVAELLAKPGDLDHGAPAKVAKKRGLGTSFAHAVSRSPSEPRWTKLAAIRRAHAFEAAVCPVPERTTLAERRSVFFASSAHEGGVTGSSAPESRRTGTSLATGSRKLFGTSPFGHRSHTRAMESPTSAPKRVPSASRAMSSRRKNGTSLGADHREEQAVRGRPSEAARPASSERHERAEIAGHGAVERERHEGGEVRRVEQASQRGHEHRVIDREILAGAGHRVIHRRADRIGLEGAGEGVEPRAKIRERPRALGLGGAVGEEIVQRALGVPGERERQVHRHGRDAVEHGAPDVIAVRAHVHERRARAVRRPPQVDPVVAERFADKVEVLHRDARRVEAQIRVLIVAAARHLERVEFGLEMLGEGRVVGQGLAEQTVGAAGPSLIDEHEIALFVEAVGHGEGEPGDARRGLAGPAGQKEDGIGIRRRGERRDHHDAQVQRAAGGAGAILEHAHGAAARWHAHVGHEARGEQGARARLRRALPGAARKKSGHGEREKSAGGHVRRA